MIKWVDLQKLLIGTMISFDLIMIGVLVCFAVVPSAREAVLPLLQVGAFVCIALVLVNIAMYVRVVKEVKDD